MDFKDRKFRFGGLGLGGLQDRKFWFGGLGLGGQ